MSISLEDYPYQTSSSFDVSNTFGGYFPVHLHGIMRIGYSENLKSAKCEVEFYSGSYIRNNTDSSLVRGGFWNALCIGWNTTSLIKTNPSGVSNMRTLSNANQDDISYAKSDVQSFLSTTGRWSNLLIGATQSDKHNGSDVIKINDAVSSNPAGKTFEKTWTLSGNGSFLNSDGKIDPIYPFYISNRWYNGQDEKAVCGYIQIEGFPPVIANMPYFPYATWELNADEMRWMSCNRHEHGYQRYDGTSWMDRKNDAYGSDDTAFRYNGTNFNTVLPITGTE